MCSDAGVLVRRLLSCVAVTGVIAAVTVGCASQAADDDTASSDLTAGKRRNFALHPAVVEVEDADHVYALSDPHGDYDGLVKLLAANHLVGAASSDDPRKVKWTGGTAVLLVVGDLIDKGTNALGVIDLLRSLEPQAKGAGGRVIVTMGNHEAEFLVDPKNHKAMSTGRDEDGIDEQLAARGIDPKMLAAGTDPEGRGRWLAELPLAARVKRWFFAHGGNTHGRSLDDLRKKLESSIAKNGFGDDDITGGESILEAQQWYGNPGDDNAGEKEVDGLGHVRHIVFGHDPGALNDRGRIRQSKNGLLVKLDVAMGLHDHGSAPNPGALLHISTTGDDKAESLDPDGHAHSID